MTLFVLLVAFVLFIELFEARVQAKVAGASACTRGPLYRDGLEGAVRIVQDETSRLLDAAAAGDAGAEAVARELNAAAWGVLAAVVAWPIVAAALVRERERER